MDKYRKYYIIGGLVFVFLLFVLAHCANAAEGITSKHPVTGDTIQVWEKPCHVPGMDQLRAAEWTGPDGKKVLGCYRDVGTALCFQFDDGDKGCVPTRLFKPGV